MVMPNCVDVVVMIVMGVFMGGESIVMKDTLVDALKRPYEINMRVGGHGRWRWE